MNAPEEDDMFAYGDMSNAELRAHIQFARMKTNGRSPKLWQLELEAAEAELQRRKGPPAEAESPKKGGLGTT